MIKVSSWETFIFSHTNSLCLKVFYIQTLCDVEYVSVFKYNRIKN